ncbi:MAG: hypothetical protein KIT84_28350 [Labilithrix sp.]|nr:hypothetical protein [Labilithrix sp.]MCW5814971.1 hypothetical protein [Labilithrix sp.]
MGYDLLGGLFFAALTPLVILGFVVFWIMTSRERRHVEDTWETFAARRVREYVPARGEWPNRSSPGVRWTHDDVVYELTALGVEANARTRLGARPRGRILGSFVLRPAATPDVSEQPAGLSTRVLDDATRRAFLGFRQRDDVVLAYRRGRVTLEWPGRECNDARIDEAERVVTAVVHAVEAAFRDAGRRMAS